MYIRLIAVLGCLGLAAGSGFGQSDAGQPAAVQPVNGQQGYTLKATARVVLTDVVVTDANGDPVHGLDRAKFHIFDNGREQQVGSFEEHTGIAQEVADASGPAKPNVYSNDFLRHPAAVYNVIMLDTSTIDILDQMYLSQQLVKLIDALPPGVPLAIYLHNGDVAIQLQGFTSDHALLLKALNKAIPRLKRPGSWALNEVDALQQMSVYLAQIPGRKNLLWFTGGSNLYLMADLATVNSMTAGGAGTASFTTTPSVDMRATYDRLEAARIAVYPIDARGLTTGTDLAKLDQQSYMEEQAESTGGHAYFNNNGIAEIANKIVQDDGSFYSLSYAPADFKVDNKWHRVKVKIDGEGYKLSYRQGYFGDGSNLPEGVHRPKVMRADKDGQEMVLPEEQSAPMIFKASVLPADVTSPPEKNADALKVPAKHGEVTYTVRFRVPAAAFATETAGGSEIATIGAGILAFNQYGRPVERQMQKIRLTFDGGELKRSPASSLGFDEQINLPKGQDYLYVLVWDMKSGRMGTLQVPVEVAKK